MIAPTLVIGNKNYSSWSLRPWIFLRKNDIPFDEEQLWLDEPDFKPRVNRYNSGGKVPVLLDRGRQVWDSLAIIEYAIEHFDCRYGWPESDELRAHARSSVCEMHSSFPVLRAECPMDIRSKHEVELSDAAAQDIQRVCELWTQALALSGSGQGWLYGDFSVADAMFIPVVFRFDSYAVEVTARIREYMDFVIAEESLAEWIAAARQEPHELRY